ncbi:hypothetical protein, partial [Kosakonia cowanii]|uniref:hypothetical protein n=1 Tax=Kosakonia cowanii TaxID=208223 RepID=UPI004063C4A0
FCIGHFARLPGLATVGRANKSAFSTTNPYHIGIRNAHGSKTGVGADRLGLPLGKRRRKDKRTADQAKDDMLHE